MPINHRYSGEQVDQLKDMEARWKTLRRVRDVATFANPNDPVAVAIKNAPDAELYVIDVSFAALKDKAERAFLNELPTSFVLEDEEVDRLRAAAAKIVLDSSDFQRLLQDVGAKIVGSEP